METGVRCRATAGIGRVQTRSFEKASDAVMESASSNQELEVSILRISTVLTVAYAIVGMRSPSFATDDVMVTPQRRRCDRVCSDLHRSKIHQPPNEIYQYGYAKYEPFAAVDGLLIMAVCAGSIATSIQDIIHPMVKYLQLIIVYPSSAYSSAGFGLYMCQRTQSSTVLQADGAMDHRGIIAAVRYVWCVRFDVERCGAVEFRRSRRASF
jgi:predicted Co/Zn/Cd cation transporter (cation efflux family)